MSVMRLPDPDISGAGYNHGHFEDDYRMHSDDRRSRSATRSSTIGAPIRQNGGQYNFAAVAAAALSHSSLSLDYNAQNYYQQYPRSPVHHQRYTYSQSPPQVQVQPPQGGFYSPSPKRSGHGGANFYWTARVKVLHFLK